MLTCFQNSFIVRLSGKLVMKSYLNVPLHLKHVATLLCEIPMLKNCHAEEIIEANCHVRLKHSKNCFIVIYVVNKHYLIQKQKDVHISHIKKSYDRL